MHGLNFGYQKKTKCARNSLIRLGKLKIRKDQNRGFSGRANDCDGAKIR